VQPAQGLAEVVLEAGASKARLCPQLREHHPDLAFFEAEVAQGREEFGLGVERLGLDDVAVDAAIGMAKDDAAVGSLLDEQRSAMRCAMMAATNGEDIPELVAAALGAQLDVMQIEKRRISAARHLAAVLVAQQHGPPQRGRDTLLGAGARLRASRGAD
jgi:hypothetical protein